MTASTYPQLKAADNLVLDAVTGKPVAVVLPGNYNSSELAAFIAEAGMAATETAILRRVLADTLAALGDGQCMAASAAAEVFCAVPAEVERVVKTLKAEQLSTMKRLTARIQELEQALTSARVADPPVPSPTHVVPGVVCRWCSQDGIQQYDKDDTVCPKCHKSIFTGPDNTGLYLSAKAMMPVPTDRRRYHVIQGDSPDVLQKRVESMLFDGWRLVGGVHVTSHDALLRTEPVLNFYQAVER